MVKNYDDMLSRFHLTERFSFFGTLRTEGQHDRQTDRFAISMSRISMLMCDKNCCFIALCKAHSIVTHVKQQKYFHHLKGHGYNKDCVLYAQPLRC